MPFLSGIWGKIVAVGAITLAILAALAKVFYAGKTEAKAEGMKEQLDNVEKRNTVDEIVGAKPDAAVRDELRRKYTDG